MMMMLQIALGFLLTASASMEEDSGKAATLFSGPVEVVSEDPRFRWLESPLWSSSGNYLLFSDVKGRRNDHIDDITCGNLYKYDDTSSELTQLLKCAGIIGPLGIDVDESNNLPTNMTDRMEGGSNGLYWANGWGGFDGEDMLLMHQFGWQRLVRFNVNDVDEETATIDPELVTVVADTYNGTMLSSPNDLVVSDGGDLYFTDPPFGAQTRFSDEDPFAQCFDRMPQDKPAVYRLARDSPPEELERILEYDVPTNWTHRHGPNGIAVNEENGDLAVVITETEPYYRVEIYPPNDDGSFNPEPKRILRQKVGSGAWTDGITYDANLRVLFVSGPQGIYIYEAFGEYDLLGVIDVGDDKCPNNVIGGGYLWVTCEHSLRRIPLAGTSSSEESIMGEQSGTSSSTKWYDTYHLLAMALLVLLF